MVEDERVEPVAVVEQPRHPIAGPHTSADEPGRDGEREVEQLGPGSALVALAS